MPEQPDARSAVETIGLQGRGLERRSLEERLDRLGEKVPLNGLAAGAAMLVDEPQQVRPRLGLLRGLRRPADVLAVMTESYPPRVTTLNKRSPSRVRLRRDSLTSALDVEALVAILVYQSIP